MKKLILVFGLVFSIATMSVAQDNGDGPGREHKSHEYSDYEKLIYKNVSAFHMAFNAHNFVKNGELVADSLKVNSNGVVFTGRDLFVKRIARFLIPFPDVKITDMIITVDGNTASIRYVITGTQDGDLQTPEGVLKATHHKIHVDGAEFFTFDKDGKLINLVSIERGDELMAQLKGK